MILGIEAGELRSILNANRASLDELMAIADFEAARHGAEAGLISTQIAAAFAWRNHSGVFASPKLESIVAAAARRLPRVSYAGSSRGASTLHVATEIYPTGGHTRLLARWLAESRERQDLALIRQAMRVPRSILDAVGVSGGRIHDLSHTGGLTSRASILRSLARDVGHVALHSHPYDVTPLAAFASNSETPVTLVNHADHTFWLGATMADRVVSIRDSGDRLAGSRRGIHERKRRVMPIPIDPPESTDRRRARQRLALPDDELVIVTVAPEYKLASRRAGWYADVMRDVLAALPQTAHLIVVGTPQLPSGRSGEVRITAVGEVPDPALYYAAADIYLDAFPIASMTSLLEAASLGRPVVSYCLWPSGAEILCADSPGLDGHIRVGSAAELTDCLGQLGADEALRERHGEALASSVAANNTAAGWTTLGAPNLERDHPWTPVDEISVLDLALNAVGQVDPGRERAIQSQIRLGSTLTRVRLWLAARKSGHRLALSALLPERLAIAMWRRSRL